MLVTHTWRSRFSHSVVGCSGWARDARPLPSPRMSALLSESARSSRERPVQRHAQLRATSGRPHRRPGSSFGGPCTRSRPHLAPLFCAFACACFLSIHTSRQGRTRDAPTKMSILPESSPSLSRWINFDLLRFESCPISTRFDLISIKFGPNFIRVWTAWCGRDSKGFLRRLLACRSSAHTDFLRYVSRRRVRAGSRGDRTGLADHRFGGRVAWSMHGSGAGSPKPTP